MSTSRRPPLPPETLLAERAWVRRVARALAGSAFAGDDLEQDAWVAALRDGPGEPGAVRAWFRRVLRNGLLQGVRSGERRRRREEAGARPEREPSTEEIVARAEAHRRVVDAVFALGEPLRTTVVLRFFEDLTPADIGVRMGVPADTVRARLRRALAELRGGLEPEDEHRAPAWALVLGAPLVLPPLVPSPAGTSVPAPLPSPAPPPVHPAAPPPVSAAPLPVLTGGALVSGSTSKFAASVAVLALLAGGGAWWALGTSGDGTGAGGAVPAADDDGATPAAASPAEGAARPAERAAGAAAEARAVARTGSALLVGDVRFREGDRPAEDVEVSLAGPGVSLRARTDASGLFRLDLPPGGAYAATAAASGFAPAREAGLHLAEGEVRRLATFWLDAPVRVDVDVVAPDGSAVEGARVEAYRTRLRIERQDWDAKMPEPVAAAETDAKGRATFGDLAIGSWTFRALHPAFAPAGDAAPTVLRGGVSLRVVLRMEAGHGLEGTVTGVDGNGVADALVCALPPVEATELREPRPVDPLRVETRTDAAGRYRFAALRTGEHSIAVMLPGNLPARIGVVSIPSVSRFDIRFDGGTIAGRVTEEGTGRPIEGARVRGAVWRRHSPTYLSALTDGDGRYSLAVPLGGILQGPSRGEGEAQALPVHFDVEKEGYVLVPGADPTPWRNPWVLGGGATEVNPVLRPAASLSGVVTGPDGPVAGADVTADVWNPLRGSVPSRTVTDTEGAYRFGGLPEGRARIVVARPGYVQVASPGGGWRSPSPPDPGAVVEIPLRGEARHDVRLERGARITGRTVAPGEAPVAAALVEALADGVVVQRATSDATGMFAIDGAPLRTAIRLRASCEGYATAELEVGGIPDPDAAAGDPVRLVLETLGSVRGRVLGPDGAPAAGAWVQVAPARVALETGYEIVSVWQRATRRPVAADGTFEAPVEDLDAGSRGDVVVRAGAPGLAPVLSERLPAGAADAGTLRLDAGHRLEGRVVAADGSGPVANAEIEFMNERLPPALGQRRDWSAVGRNNMPFEFVARSDADGRFVVEGLPAWRYELRVNAEGFGGAGPTVAVPQEAPATVELDRLLPIAGRVEDEGGAVVAGAMVVAHDPGGGPAGQTESKADGTFELPWLGEGRFVLEARRPWDRSLDVLPARTGPIDAGTRDVRIVVRRGGGTISGRCVTASGAAVPGAVIRMKTADGPLQMARSGPDGTFAATGLAEGVWSIAADASRSLGGPEAFGRKLVAEATDLPVGARDVLLEFRDAASITGRIVRDDGGAPAGRLLVQAKRTPDGRWTRFAQAAQDGSFALEGLTPGTWALVVVDQDTGTHASLVGGAEFAAGAADVRLVVAATRGLAGRVTDEKGRPVERVNVRATPAGGGDAREIFTDAQGRFQWSGLPAGDWTVTARHPDVGRAEATRVATGAPEISLVLRADAVLSARLLDGAGRPVRQADVAVTDDAGAVVARCRTDSEGRFETRALPAGEYGVRVLGIGSDRLEAPAVLGRLRTGAPDVVFRM